MSAAEAAWLRSPYGAVYDVLVESLDSPVAALVPGTGGAIHAALAWFRHIGDAAAVRRLEAIALNVHELQLALRSGEARGARRIALAAQAKDWLAAAPMFPSGIPGEERQAA